MEQQGARKEDLDEAELMEDTEPRSAASSDRATTDDEGPAAVKADTSAKDSRRDRRSSPDRQQRRERDDLDSRRAERDRDRERDSRRQDDRDAPDRRRDRASPDRRRERHDSDRRRDRDESDRRADDRFGRGRRHDDDSRRDRGDRDRGAAGRRNEPEARDGRGRGREEERRDGDRRAEGANGPTAAAPADAPAADAAAAAAAEPAAAAAPRKPLAAGPAGGVYIPPFKLAQMMREVDDKTSPQYQRLTWDALRKSINGLINRANTENIGYVMQELFNENMVRGQGLLCRSLMKSQLASPKFTPIFACIVAVVNTKFPEIGELLGGRLVMQFKRSFKRNDKPVCSAAAKFIAHLVNQQVLHEVIALEVMMLLLSNPSDDSVEIATDFMKEVGAFLQEFTPSGLQFALDAFRAVLMDGDIETRTKYIIEALFAIRKGGRGPKGEKIAPFQEFPIMPKGLDLVEEGDQITHRITLEDTFDPRVALDVFKVDPDYAKHEEEYEQIRQALGVKGDSDKESDSEGEGGSGEEDSSESEDEEEEARRLTIQDQTETNLVNLRRTIYLTIMSALQAEEGGHKLTKIQVQPGEEKEVAQMIIECCSQEKTYLRYYGLMAQRFSYNSDTYKELFEECFKAQYSLVHRLDTNKLRNVAKFFSHLLETDAISWEVLKYIRLTEDDTTSSSRIFIKILFQELSSNMQLKELKERLENPICQEWFEGIFPKDTTKNMRFSINFFTSIGLGGLTDTMRTHLQELPKLLAAQRAAAEAAKADESSSSEDSSSDDSSSDDSSDDSSSDDSSSDDSSSDSDSDSDSDAPPQKLPPPPALPPPPQRLPSPPPRPQSNGRGHPGDRGRDRDASPRAPERRPERDSRRERDFREENRRDPRDDRDRERDARRGDDDSWRGDRARDPEPRRRGRDEDEDAGGRGRRRPRSPAEDPEEDPRDSRRVRRRGGESSPAAAPAPAADRGRGRDAPKAKEKPAKQRDSPEDAGRWGEGDKDGDSDGGRWGEDEAAGSDGGGRGKGSRGGGRGRDSIAEERAERRGSERRGRRARSSPSASPEADKKRRRR